MVNTLTLLTIGMPLLGAAIIFFLNIQRENAISWIALVCAALNSIFWLGSFALWAHGGFEPIDEFLGTLFEYHDYHFDITFQIDRNTIVFQGLIALIAGIVVKYSQYYMHREPGYKRFFINILIFLGGINLLALAGTLDLLFAGWEVVGISSFLLIAFYRERIQPTRHALRTYTVYRFCDTGLLVGAWLSHLVWHASPTFSDLASNDMLLVLRQAGEPALLGLSLLMLVAAAGKSAQFPFTWWLPRAMEGPTPSSAIFYGALSIHAGVFLLLRMGPVWHASHTAPYIVGALGLLTAFLSTVIGHAQSNIKGQIAYASSAQVGLMYIELALGLDGLVLIHMVGNATLRCFQLLVSPSIIAFVLRWQGEGGGGIRVLNVATERWMPQSWKTTFYVFCLNEGFVESAVRFAFWRPFRSMGNSFARFSRKPATVLPLLIVLVVGVSTAASGSRDWIAGVLVAISIGLCSYAMASKASFVRAWDAVVLGSIAMAASIAFVDHEGAVGAMLVAAGSGLGWALGRYGLARLQACAPGARLDDYHGLVAREPWSALALFIGFLLVGGFPIGPGFLGEDLLLHSTVRIGQWSTAVMGLVFVLNGIALARIFVRASFAGSYREPLPYLRPGP